MPPVKPGGTKHAQSVFGTEASWQAAFVACFASLCRPPAGCTQRLPASVARDGRSGVIVGRTAKLQTVTAVVCSTVEQSIAPPLRSHKTLPLSARTGPSMHRNARHGLRSPTGSVTWSSARLRGLLQRICSPSRALSLISRQSNQQLDAKAGSLLAWRLQGLCAAILPRRWSPDWRRHGQPCLPPPPRRPRRCRSPRP